MTWLAELRRRDGLPFWSGSASAHGLAVRLAPVDRCEDAWSHRGMHGHRLGIGLSGFVVLGVVGCGDAGGGIDTATATEGSGGLVTTGVTTGMTSDPTPTTTNTPTTAGPGGNSVSGTEGT